MPIIMTPVSSPAGITLAQLAAEARHFLDELDSSGRLADESAGEFVLYDAIKEAYVEYSKITKCFPGGPYRAYSVAQQSRYTFDHFRSDGRLFTLEAVGYNGREIKMVTRDWLDTRRPNWRYANAGTPEVFFLDGDSAFTVYPAPDSSGVAMDVWGYLTADLSGLTEPDDSVAIHPSRCRLLSAYAAAMIAIRFAGVPEAQVQGTAAWQIWQDGIKAAIREMRGSPEETVGRIRSRIANDWNIPTISVGGG